MAARNPGASAPTPYWEQLTTPQLIEGYLKPHAAKAEDEGRYVCALAILEAVRRLEQSL